MIGFARRWGFSLALLGVSVFLGVYILGWHNPLHKAGPFETLSPSETSATEPLSLYHWDTLERMRLVKRGPAGDTLRIDYERATPHDPGLWRVSGQTPGQSRSLKLSDFEQVLLKNTLEQLRVLNVRRLLLTEPTSAQLQSFGLGPLEKGAIEVILHGQKKGVLQEQRLFIGDAAPTGSGYYFYIPSVNQVYRDQVYLGYVNIPEALKQLLVLSEAATSS